MPSETASRRVTPPWSSLQDGFTPLFTTPSLRAFPIARSPDSADTCTGSLSESGHLPGGPPLAEQPIDLIRSEIKDALECASDEQTVGDDPQRTKG